jgi:hypothetical protein
VIFGPALSGPKGGEGRSAATHSLVGSLPEIPRRFDSLPVRRLFGIDFPVAEGLVARSRGLALLHQEAAGPGLVIPRCRSIHTFGMLFSIDLFLFDRRGSCISVRLGVGPGRIVFDRRARSVLEARAGLIPDRLAEATLAHGGENPPAGT